MEICTVDISIFSSIVIDIESIESYINLWPFHFRPFEKPRGTPQECPFERYDLTIGTSERGEVLGLGRLPKFQSGRPVPLVPKTHRGKRWVNCWGAGVWLLKLGDLDLF